MEHRGTHGTPMLHASESCYEPRGNSTLASEVK